ncbi:MAG: twin-arginine translocation signal domain-containing protein, partial [Candidatus Nanopelagicales bacterium]|nr:twin-arginine translocation signal domain-containing protein [Candidatus Nanopelagicales bacterium]
MTATRHVLVASAADVPDRLMGSMSRRRLLQVAGVGGAAVAVAACGAGGGDTASASGTPSAASAADQSATDKVANWSTWPSYLDIDEASGQRPTLEAFTKQSGITVNY